jgi:hypothetical protein
MGAKDSGPVHGALIFGVDDGRLIHDGRRNRMSRTRQVTSAVAIGAGIVAALFLAASVFAGPAGAGGSASSPSAPSTDACAGYNPQVPAPAHFVATIDNPYFPLPVGTTFISRGVEGSRREIDRMAVTKGTKVIQGVTTTVVRDILRHQGVVIEKTFDWYAQDDQGNVWYFGEDTKVFLKNGKVDPSGSWETGVNGALPGIIMEADPQIPDAYRQECLSGQAEDSAWTIVRGGSTTVPYGTVHQVVRSLEFSPLEPNVVSEKVYGPGLGIVQEFDLHGGDESFQLVKVKH